jgi:hypothetical protein
MKGPKHQSAPDGRGFYVSAIKGRKKMMLAGPFRTFGQAHGLKETIRLKVIREYADAWDIAVGTAQGPDDLPTAFGRDGWRQAA